MKKIIPAILFALLLAPTFAQVSIQEMKYDTLGYIFPKLTDGRITLKDGSQFNTLFNYGYRQQDFLYYDNEKKEVLQLANLQDVLLIRAGNKYFIPIMSGIGELIIYDDICLAYYKRLKVDERDRQTGYGSASTSATGNVITDRAIQSAQNPNLTHYTQSDPNQRTLSERVASGELRIVIQEDFYLSEIGDTKVIPLTKKNLIKKYPQHTSFIESYFAEKKPDLRNKNEVMRIVYLLNNMK
jgi:hypothetical protein